MPPGGLMVRSLSNALSPTGEYWSWVQMSIVDPKSGLTISLRYRPSLAIAVVEAKADYKNPRDGLQQAMEYVQILDLKFAYSTNGYGIVEHAFLTGRETALDIFLPPDELWSRLNSELRMNTLEQQQRCLAPTLSVPGKPLRYYQELAINRVIQAIMNG